MLTILSKSWFFFSINKFENNLLIFQIILNVEKIKFFTNALNNTEVFEYNFIDEKIAQLACNVLNIRRIFFSFKAFNVFR